MKLNKSDYYFDLPEELIAQYPIEKRDSSNLLLLEKSSGKLRDSQFFNIIDHLNPGDCLVINNTKVIPARIFGKKVETGAKIELMLIKQIHEKAWEALVKPGKKAPKGTKIDLNGAIATVGDTIDEHGSRIVHFELEGNLIHFLEEKGNEPLPPYIKREVEESDKTRYQTVYAKNKGAVAAPTAGLHFTEDLLKKVKEKGVSVVEITLHVGLGTFRPVKVENIKEHKMHSEFYEISEKSAKIINSAKKSGNRIIAVGTTSLRALESAAIEKGKISAGEKDTDIFIFPGYEFKMIDALITNFHTPESTLLMLVSALAGYQNIMIAYQHAVNKKYRFFSYGDAMFIY
jgi:S-adenosylmethionine:tRNA ribosyltransferase-isomerase